MRVSRLVVRRLLASITAKYPSEGGGYTIDPDVRRAAITIAIAVAIAIGVFAIGIVGQEVFFPGHSAQEQALHLRWHVREVITAIIALDAGALYIVVAGTRPLKS